MQDFKEHKFYDLAYRAHCGTSHVPETRAISYVQDFDRELAKYRQKVSELGGDPELFEAGYTARWTAWMYAKGRCISSMITGPSNFPTRRAEKANNTERKRMNEFVNYCENFLKRLQRDNARKEKAESDPVFECHMNIVKAEALQKMMVAANKICRSRATPSTKLADLVALGIPEKTAGELLIPGLGNVIGFPAFRLTNNNANIKRMKQRLAELERRAAATTVEQELAEGVTVVQNAEADRLQVFFPGKPAAATIALLKKAAFKWSPTNGCWQRQLTENAKQALNQVLTQI